MMSFTVYPENGTQCVLFGENIQTALKDNMNVILHYLGNKAKIINYDIENISSKSEKKNKIKIEYLRYKSYSSKKGEMLVMVLWADEQLYVKMPWEK